MKLNAGCGRKPLAGFVNVDIDRGVAPDLVADINGGLPFRDGACERIYCDNVLEHLRVEGILELFRLLSKEGVLEAIVPYCMNYVAYNDATHRVFFNTETFRKSIFRRLEVRSMKVRHRYANGRIDFALPLALVRVQERLFPGVLPPSCIHVELGFPSKPGA
ncbi:MAG: hypothetical protein KA123_03420 [Candidatus Eisenbacteria bacterium]|nr:hypothetical protein [Candidatus Eisenbacteria bacterium]